MLDDLTRRKKLCNCHQIIGSAISLCFARIIITMVDKTDILANFDLDDDLSDCSTDENISDLSLSETSSEDCNYKDCNNDSNIKNTGGADKQQLENLSEIGDITMNQSDEKTEQDDANEPITKAENFESYTENEKNISTINDKEDEFLEPVEKEGETYNLPWNADERNNNDSERNEGKPLELSNQIDLPENDQGDFDEDIPRKIISENNSTSYQYFEFSNLEKSFDSNKQLFDPQKTDDKKSFEETNIQNYRRSNENLSEMTKDEKKFQNLQDEINLLNTLMYEAENHTEKCGSLYNSFTNEINNTLSYSTSKVVNDCANSIASYMDRSKCDAISVNSELLFSDYGKSESNFDLSESGAHQEKISTIESNLNSEETKSISSIIENISAVSENSDCKTCKVEINNRREEDKSQNKNIPVEDRILVMWNQIIRLKCSLKNLQLDLKEKQMETLMQVNEFLLNQNTLCETPRNSSSSLYNKNSKEPYLPIKLSNKPYTLNENSKIKEDIALNNLKIALIECNMLSSTASSLVNSLPDLERSVSNVKKTTVPSNKLCCCKRIRHYAVCSCPNSSKNLRLTSERPFEDQFILKRSFNAKIKLEDERKVKSDEEIAKKFPETKYCQSELHLEEFPKVCI